MWKAALLVLLSCTSHLASGGRLPRNDDGGSEEDCLSNSDCRNGFVCSDNLCVQSGEEFRGKCENDEECKIPHQVCSDGKCVQKNASLSGLGDACTETPECDSSAGLICESETCQCAADHVQINSNCLKKASKIGEDCAENAQCEDLKGFCSNGTCQVLSGSKTKICDEKNSDILADQCQCEEGFVKSEDLLQCLKKAEELGESCASSRQCEHLNATCSDNACLAVAVMAAPAEETSKQAITSPCKHNDDCKSVNDAVCKESICQCKIEYVSSEDQSKCLLLARKAGDQCEIDKQCSKVFDSSCLEGKCVAVAAAGIKTRSNGSSPPLGASVQVVPATFLVIASKILL